MALDPDAVASDSSLSGDDGVPWEAKRAAVLRAVQADVAGVDLSVSLFTAAASSYRMDSVLRPFPKCFATETRPADGVVHRTLEDFDRVRSTLERVPRAADLEAFLAMAEGSTDESTRQTVDLLHWINCSTAHRVSSCSPALIDGILAQSESAPLLPSQRPDHVFCLDYEPGGQFDSLREQYGSLIAFHGTPLENFYSITRLGFCAHMNKTSLYGKGTYLSSEISVCMDFSKPGRSWQKSGLGLRLTCIAACEVIKHPEVKLPGRIADDPESTGLGSHVKIPEKYIVVPNNDHVRVKYIFVFVDHHPETTAVVRRSGNWFAEHKFITVMLLYALVLLLVSVAKSTWWKRFVKSLS